MACRADTQVTTALDERAGTQRGDAGQSTVFVSVGLVVEDVASAKLVHDRAAE